MNTLVSIVIGIVLNFLGVEVQERQNMAQLQAEITKESIKNQCEEISEENYNTYNITSVKKEHKCKLSK